MRAAGKDDRTAILNALRRRKLVSIFPLANLAQKGWEREAERAMRFWLSDGADCILGLTLGGMLMPSAAEPAFADARAALSGRRLTGAAGEARVVEALLSELKLQDHHSRMRETGIQMRLEPNGLLFPPGHGHLVPLSEIDRDLAIAWRAAYEIETLGASPATANVSAAAAVDAQIETGSHVALIVQGGPVAVTGINAEAEGVVQLGGIWTTPERRRRGHARRAVALDLARRFASGARIATLFTSNPGAVQLYEGLGFWPCGEFALIFFAEEARVP